MYVHNIWTIHYCISALHTSVIRCVHVRVCVCVRVRVRVTINLLYTGMAGKDDLADAVLGGASMTFLWRLSNGMKQRTSKRRYNVTVMIVKVYHIMMI